MREQPRAWPWTRLGVQIAIVIFLSVGVMAAVALWRVQATVSADTEALFAEQIQRGAREADAQLRNIQSIALLGASAFATRQDFVTNIDRGDLAAALQRAVVVRESASAAVPGRTGLSLYGRDGTLLFRAHAPFNRAQAATPPEVRQALAGTAVSTLRRDEVLGLAVAAAAPLLTTDGRTVGAVGLLTSIEGGFAQALGDLTGLRVAILGPDGLVATSEAGWAPTGAEIHADAEAAERPYYLDIGGRQFLSMVVPLRDRVSGTALGDLYVGIDRAQIEVARREASMGVLWAVAAAVGAGSALALGFGVVLTRPLSALVRSAREIQQNDLQRPVPQSGPREFRALGAAMDEMRLAIRAAREQMAALNATLAERAAASTAGLSEATQELAVLHAITTQLVAAPAESPRVAAEELARLAWVDAACVGLFDADGRLMVAAERGFRANVATVLLGAVERERAAAVTGAGIFVADTSASAAMRPLAPLGVHALAAVPLETARGAAGVVAVTVARATPFTESRRALLRAVASEVIAAVERFELADEVEESRRLAESVLREMADGAIVLDAAGVCQVCNAAAARMLGVEREAAIGQPATRWLTPPVPTLERLRALGEQATDSVPLLVERGERLLAFSAGPLPDPDPGRRGLIVLIRDVTDIFVAERLKQDFVTMVGHELRTPLTLIRTSIDLLTEAGMGPLTPTQGRIAEVLKNNSDRLLHLINDLLDMSALDSGRVQVHAVMMPLGDVVAEVLDSARREPEAEARAFMIEAPRGAVYAWADRGRVRQVLSNLVSNAMKYTRPGGHVTVRVVPGEPSVRVEVRDDGIGIPPEEQPLLFQKFYRTPAGERQSGGTGLGLAIARSIVELHGGEIWCESDGRSGSTFAFTLPAHEPAGAPPGA